MKSKGVPALIPFLIVISAIFIGILIAGNNERSLSLSLFA